jgi:nucleoside-diphosphate-sugar epimerase
MSVEGLERLIMTIAVTGATGFIGSHLIKRLVLEGNEVIALKRTTSDISRIHGVAGKVRFYDTDRTELDEIFRLEDIDCVVHLATNYGRKGGSARDIIDANITFPAEIIAASLKNGLKVFINTDTSAQGSCTFYSSTKKGFLEILKYFHKGKGLDVFNLKLEYVYGPGDDDSKFLPFMIGAVIDGKEIDASPGMQKRDFVFIDDVVEAYMRCISASRKGSDGFVSLDIGSGIAFTFRRVAGIVERLAGRKAAINWGALKYRKNEMMESKADITGPFEDIGWRPGHSLDEGLVKTVDWYMKEATHG